MYRRLDPLSRRLVASGVDPKAQTEQMLERMTGDANPEALRILAAVVEPPKEYAREDLRPYTSQTPLNRLVDAVSPESETSRQFAILAKRIAAGGATAQDWQQAQDWLTLWRDNDARLQPILAQSDLTAELAPVSKSLCQTAEIGLEALSALENRKQNKPMTAEQQKKQLAALVEAEKPQAVLLLMVAPSVELLVRAASSAPAQ
jgi:hexosaminidase